MKLCVQILGAPTQGSSPSVLIICEQNRYLFNAGEGLQRVCIEHRARLQRISHMFCTDASLQCIGGLPGVLLTVGDTPKGMFHVHGPHGLANYLFAAREFLRCSRLRLHLHEYHQSSHCTITTPDLTFHPIVIVPSSPEPVVITATTDAVRSDVPTAAHKRKRDHHTDSKHEEAHESLLPAPPEFFRTSLLVDTVPHPTTVPYIVTPSTPSPVVCYECVSAPTLGTFHPDRALALGVPKGPLFGKLSRNETITLPSGVVITPDQVKDPDIPGQVIFMVSCPTVAHVSHVVTHSHWAKYYSETIDTRVVVVHLGPREVVLHTDYVEWISKFTSAAVHIYADTAQEYSHESWPELRGKEFIRIPLHASAEFAVKLNTVSATMFPVPSALRCVEQQLPSSTDVMVTQPTTTLSLQSVVPSLTLKGTHTLATPLLQYSLIPVRTAGFDTSLVLPPVTQPSTLPTPTVTPVTPSDAISSLPSSSVAITTTATITTPATQLTSTNSAFLDDPHAEIVFLGTSAAIPSKYRNVSGVYLRVSEHSAVMLDCGEGTWHQMCRVFGVVGVDTALAHVKLFWISHMHPDHHLGLPRLLLERARIVGASDPAVVIGPSPLQSWLRELSCLYPSLSTAYVFYDASVFWRRGCTESAKTVLSVGGISESLVMKKVDGCEEVLIVCRPPWVAGPPKHTAETQALITQLLKMMGDRMGIAEVEVTAVEHCSESYGVKLTSVKGWSVVYSGDTRPSPSLIDLGKNCDLLIHEATFDNSCHSDAFVKWHCTALDALSVSEAMSAKYTLLTHFSARYPKLPHSDATAHVGFSFDLMRIKPSQLLSITPLVPLLEAIWGETETEDEILTVTSS